MLSALAFSLTAAPVMAQSKPTPKIVAYVPNWIDLPAFAETIDYAKITHINLAFENPLNADGDLSFNPQNEILITKAKANKIPICVSIGGGAASSDKELTSRYFDLISDAKRTAFVAKLTDYVVTHRFDGLDVDIEGPAINTDYGAFIRDLAQALKAKGKLLTAALSQGYGGSNVPDSVFGHYDFLNIMAYDGAGPWSPTSPGQHSSFEFAKSNVDYWLKRGLPKSKAVLGVPFYGYGFGDAFRNRDYPYKEIITLFPGAEMWDQLGNSIWHNGIPTIRAKAQYAKEQGLGGIMIWSLDYDVTGDRSLLSAIAEVLVPRTSQVSKK
jgi:chitinase